MKGRFRHWLAKSMGRSHDAIVAFAAVVVILLIAALIVSFAFAGSDVSVLDVMAPAQ